MKDCVSPGTGSRTAAADNWDFFTGRGEGATAGDRSAVAQQRAVWSLGRALAGDDAFWGHADQIAKASEPARVTQSAARLYVPRRSIHRAAITRMLYIASQHVDDRESQGWLRLVNAGLIAYHPASDPRPGMPRYALRPDAIRTIDLGARMVARRGAQKCLECAAQLSSKPRRDYCDPCYRRLNDELGLVRHAEAIRTVLDRATPMILSRSWTPRKPAA